MARPSLFGAKSKRYQCWVTVAGVLLFERTRKELSKALDMTRAPSDGEVLEYVLRGRKITRASRREPM